jgi:3-hydroxyisobutyrate dehydrogenase-like beta-hydroxyacid dehydrogenase
MGEVRTVGFVGTGIMGRAMANRLQQAGFALRVFNRTPEKAHSLVAGGAVLCTSPREAARTADAVITMVTDTPDVEAVTFGPGGIDSGAAPGTLVIDMSTIAPDASRDFAARLRQRGLAPLDAPVSGGDVGAEQGSLTIMVGGESSDFERARPLFEALGHRVTRVGPSGTGQTVKACNQVLCAVNLVAVCEALTLARAASVDLAQLLEVVTAGAAGSWALEQLGPKIANGDFSPGFMVRLIQKDLAIVDSTARSANLALPGVALATQMFRAAARQGAGDRGTQAMALAYEELTGVRVRREA